MGKREDGQADGDSVPVGAGDLPEALARILAPPGAQRARRAAVRGFLAYLDNSPCRTTCRRNAAGTAWLLVLFVPGNTAVLMLSDPDGDPGGHRGLLEEWLAGPEGAGNYYQQCLLDPRAGGRAHLIGGLGFERLTRLLYLERSATYPWVEPRSLPGAAWRTGDEIGDGPFASTLPRTYIDSGDCPELAGSRPIAAVLDSHKAAGVFDPSLWHLLEVDGQAAGCLLLSRLPQAPVLEVVYMGLVPEARGRGYGRALLEQAVVAAQVRSLSQITLVVDVRNDPARRLYDAFGFAGTAERDAWIRFEPRSATDARPDRQSTTGG